MNKNLVLKKALEAKDWFEHIGDEEILGFFEFVEEQDITSEKLKNIVSGWIARTGVSAEENISFVGNATDIMMEKPHSWQDAYEAGNCYLILSADYGKHCVTKKNGLSLSLEAVSKEIDLALLEDDDDD